jgi:hypothetical protein
MSHILTVCGRLGIFFSMKPEQKRLHNVTSGLTNADRLQFAVRFAEMNLDALRPGDWLNLHEDFLNFLMLKSPVWLRDEGRVIMADDNGTLVATDQPIAHLGVSGILEWYPTPGAFTEEDFRDLQKDVRALLYSFADSQGIATAGPEIRASYIFRPYGLVAKGPPHHVFLAELLSLLQQEPRDRLLHCPECNAIFYRIRKQAFCSRVCANRVTTRRFRERQVEASTS